MAKDPGSPEEDLGRQTLEIEPLDDDDRVVGSLLWSLLVEMPEWVDRRVERFEMLDSSTVRRAVSIDFTPPMDLPLTGVPSDRLRNATTFVPLGLLAKRPLKGFDLRDQHGQPVPLMTKQQNGRLSGAALVASAEIALEGPCPSAVADQLHALTVASATDAQMMLENWKAAADSQGFAGHPLWKRLLGNDAFRDLANGFAENFVLAAVTPLEPGRRRIMKFSYVEPAVEDERTWRRILRALGWAHATFFIELPAASQARSYHLEVPAPASLEINEARVEFGRRPADALAPLSTQSGAPLMRPQRCEERRAGALAHVYADRVDPRLTTRVTVRFRARRAGLIRYALATASVVWLLLAIGLARLHDFAADPSAAAPVLVVVPGILAAIVVRPGEHELASTFFIGIRFVVSVSALTALLGAAALVAGCDYNALHRCWIALFGVASLSLCSLIASHLLPPSAKPVGYRWT